MLSKILPVSLALSGYCPYLPSIHPGSPFRNALNNTVSLVSLETGCLEWLVWFAITLQFCKATYSPHHSCWRDRQMEPLSGKLIHYRHSSLKWLMQSSCHISEERSTVWPRGYAIMRREIGVCCLFFSLGHHLRLSCGSQAPSQEVVPCDLPATHILPYQKTKAAYSVQPGRRDPQLSYHFISSSRRMLNAFCHLTWSLYLNGWERKKCLTTDFLQKTTFAEN